MYLHFPWFFESLYPRTPTTYFIDQTQHRVPPTLAPYGQFMLLDNIIIWVIDWHDIG